MATREATAGSRLTTAGKTFVTVTSLCTLLPFRVTMNVTWPVSMPATVTVWLRCPAGMTTMPSVGTPSMPELLVVRVTGVSASASALSVIVKVPEAPGATASVGGMRLVRVGPLRTVTVLCRLVLFRVAVIVAVPGARPVRGRTAVRAPAGTVSVEGTATIVGSLLISVSAVSVAGAALSVTVRLPVPPGASVRLAGSSRARLDRGGSTVRVALAVSPLGWVAVIVTVPGLSVVISPAAERPATRALLLVQVTALVTSWVVPSVRVPTPAN